MTRVDKVVAGHGNFRAPIAANFAYTSGLPDMKHASLNRMFAVSLNALNQVSLTTPLASPLGIVGVICLGEPQKAGQVIDVYQWAEFVEFTLSNGSPAARATYYYSNADGLGDYSATGPAGATIARLGHTVEATRFLVRVTTTGAKAAV